MAHSDLPKMERLRDGLRCTLKEMQRRSPVYEERMAVLEMQIADYDRRISRMREARLPRAG